MKIMNLLYKIFWKIIPFKIKYYIWNFKSNNSNYNQLNFEVHIETRKPILKKGVYWNQSDVFNLYVFILNNWNEETKKILDLVMRRYEVKKSDFFADKKNLYCYVYLTNAYINAYQKSKDLRYLNLSLKINDYIIANWYPQKKSKLKILFANVLCQVNNEISKLII